MTSERRPICTPLPHAPAYVAGLTTWRGHTVPVLAPVPPTIDASHPGVVRLDPLAEHGKFDDLFVASFGNASCVMGMYTDCRIQVRMFLRQLGCLKA